MGPALVVVRDAGAGLGDLGYTRRPRSSMNRMMTARIMTTVPIPIYMVRSLSSCLVVREFCRHVIVTS